MASFDLDELTDEEIDFLLERFDQTEPTLQRKVVATLMVQNMKLHQELQNRRSWAGGEVSENVLGPHAADRTPGT